jgi:short-chain fatty acids transporter
MASNFSKRFVAAAQQLLPSPMTIALLLTGLTFLLALLLTTAPHDRIEILHQEEVLAELSLKNPKLVSFAIPDQRDSVYMQLENGKELVLKAKNGELIFRQPVELKPQKGPIDNQVKLKKGKLVQMRQVRAKEPYSLQLLNFWQGGFFNFLTFAMQMMLILVLGHVLALTKVADWLIQKLVRSCYTTARAALIVCFFTLLVAFFNWGLALVFGAILARKVGEFASTNGHRLNYPLIGAAGYAGLMVWHGGLSGSAPLKIAEQGHEMADKMGVIPISETIFSSMNIVCALALLILLPLAMFLLGKRLPGQQVKLERPQLKADDKSEKVVGAERLDHAVWLAILVGGLMLFMGLYQSVFKPIWIDGAGFDWQFRFINPNFIIFILFGLAILFHGNLFRFKEAVAEAIGGSAGIMIQFPLYAGIMGIMLNSGLVDVFSNVFVAISNETSYPIFTFFSAGLVNMFVPSGGGQWLVQGPILIESSVALGVPLEKSIMALCYGDQITNMLQPFWALPLLGITKLKAQEILPYTFFLFVLGVIIFCGILLLF